MNIKSIETFTKEQICIVRVRTDDGAEGYGRSLMIPARLRRLPQNRP